VWHIIWLRLFDSLHPLGRDFESLDVQETVELVLEDVVLKLWMLMWHYAQKYFYCCWHLASKLLLKSHVI
jgi:hypothetical protein